MEARAKKKKPGLNSKRHVERDRWGGFICDLKSVLLSPADALIQLYYQHAKTTDMTCGSFFFFFFCFFVIFWFMYRYLSSSSEDTRYILSCPAQLVLVEAP